MLLKQQRWSTCVHFTHHSFNGCDQASLMLSFSDSCSLGMGASSETPDNKKLLEMELFQSFSCTLAVRYKNVLVTIACMNQKAV